MLDFCSGLLTFVYREKIFLVENRFLGNLFRIVQHSKFHRNHSREKLNTLVMKRKESDVAFGVSVGLMYGSTIS